MSSGTSSRLKAKKPPRRRPANAKARSRLPPRSEERRVGKECRSRGSPYQYKKKNERDEDRAARLVATHRVKRGAELSASAERYGARVEELGIDNRLGQPTAVRAGQAQPITAS